MCRLLRILGALTMLLCCGWATGRAGEGDFAMGKLPVRLKIGSSDVEFNTLNLTNSAGQSFSITRLDFLLSNLSVHRPGDGWIKNQNWQAYVSVGEGRAEFSMPPVEGRYDKMRFNVGLPPALNHSHPAQYPADHPLNPNLNGLHWSWAGGYIFFAIEGYWVDASGARSGYSFHLGNDWMLTPVELSLPRAADENASLELVLDVAKLFDFPFTPEHSSTHSREGDELAVRLRQNLQRSFSLHVHRTPTNSPSPVLPLPAPTAFTNTPYPLTISAQFPIPNLPRDNPLTTDGVALGQILFFDPRLSANNSQSCASCHDPSLAFTDAPNRVSVGASGATGTRNSMPLFNLAWKKAFFWDGRAPALREQVLEPIENPIEMHERLENVVAKLSEPAGEGEAPDYPALFGRAFGTETITADRLAMALEQFLLTQLSFDSKFDRALEGKVELTVEEKRGFELFVTEFDPRRGQFGADCFHCHGGPFFTSHGFANNGLDALFSDPGHFNATKKESDRGKFAVPSLRNVERTPPYMHDGRFATLEEVIEHYSSGVQNSATLDPNIAKHPAGGVPLSGEDKKALVAFLKTLTDEKFRGR